MTASKGQDLIGPRKAARLLGVHENTVRNYGKSGVLTPIPLIPGHRYHRFRRTEVLALSVSLQRQRLFDKASHYFDDWVVAEVKRDLYSAIDHVGVELLTGYIVLADWDRSTFKEGTSWINVYVPDANRIMLVPRFHLCKITAEDSPAPAG